MRFTIFTSAILIAYSTNPKLIKDRLFGILLLDTIFGILDVLTR